jgi:hypothetical protein
MAGIREILVSNIDSQQIDDLHLQSPATFFMHIYTPESLLTVIPEYQHSSTTGQIAHTSKVKTTRRMYAHIRVVETDIPASVFPQRVTFRVILEPLIMGVLPASVQPTVLALVLVTSLAVLAVPWINRCLERLAQKATEATKSKRE